MIWEMTWKEVTFSFATHVKHPDNDGTYPVELFGTATFDYWIGGPNPRKRGTLSSEPDNVLRVCSLAICSENSG